MEAFLEEAIERSGFEIDGVVTDHSGCVAKRAEAWARSQGLPLFTFKNRVKGIRKLEDKVADYEHKQRLLYEGECLLALWDTKNLSVARLICMAADKKMPMHIYARKLND